MFMIPFKRDTATLDRTVGWDELDRGFDQMLRVLNSSAAGAGQFTPALDVQESKDGYTITADLPGVEKKDIDLKLEDGVLTLSGTRKAAHEENADNRTWHRVERGWGAYARSLNLGDGVDAARISAQYKDGVLTINVPKKESALPQRIEVK
jgi:HSP20 family protein